MDAPKWDSLNPKDASVLVVEDNPDDARVIARVLQNFGIRRMTVVSTGEEAVSRLAAAQPWDVVLTDYGLPGMNGLRVLEQFAEVSPQTKVIVMTGLGDEHTAVSAMKLGASDYICKDELLTSGVVTSLQAALRESISARTSRMSLALAQGADWLSVAEAEADWLMIYDVEHHGYRKAAPPSFGTEEADLNHVREMLVRYLELSEHGLVTQTQKEEEGLVAAFVARGMSSQAILSLYRSCLQVMRQGKRFEGQPTAVNPLASFVRLLSSVIDEYQTIVSMSAVPVAQAV